MQKISFRLLSTNTSLMVSPEGQIGREPNVVCMKYFQFTQTLLTTDCDTLRCTARSFEEILVSCNKEKGKTDNEFRNVKLL